MTEVEWLACNDWQRMLSFIMTNASHRKLRLFLCACCRSALDPQRSEELCLAVETIENFADGLATKFELNLAHGVADNWTLAGDYAISKADKESELWKCGYFSEEDEDPQVTPETLRQLRTDLEAACAVKGASWEPLDYNFRTSSVQDDGTISFPEISLIDIHNTSEANDRVNFIRDLFGNPFSKGNITTHDFDRQVLNLTQTIYQTRAFDRMPILADALEESGCLSNEVLKHCREGVPHVRGCWVLDLILKKW